MTISKARAAWLACLLWGVACLGLLPVVLAQAAPTARNAVPTLLVVGDSLSAEYGIAAGTGWVALLAQKLKAQGLRWQVVNSSISGDTTSGGLSRLPQALAQHRPKVVVIELGANDALRGLALAKTQDNLARMVKLAQQSGAKVLLVGMQLPPNYGKRYGVEFQAMYRQVAQSSRARLTPFLLEGVANRADARDWFQADGLHPLSKAHPVMLENVWRELRPLLSS